MEDSARLIPLSALQHYLFCPRQCALIHLEQQWSENRYTAEGRILHERADHLGHERRRGVHTAMALPLASARLGLTGVADVVEFDERETPTRVRPIEYKRGRPKAHRADEVQLCAQAMCLEEMLDTRIGEGALFYGKTRRRKIVAFDEELRTLTRQVIDGVGGLFDSNRTPVADYDAKRCDRCSLMDLCQPRVLGRRRSASRWLSRQLQTLDD
ncbi:MULTISPECIES: CRISPR-associated protein Cas4 [unclassified Modicisalibacter]|uniref:CRISPR-associated protein Cas4 n=1 Tax=unclassified Modicisalibacter TaxID=2679913 RepID=UPI001CCE9009|nr:MULTISPECIES: CRISPR-associated protein Cas4 [unclassified Modicisalibacter]MBZ9558373.1 CRISPR-associated protein Cas4 [Modicisalibacter sp. R2A 31.J]MBZ9575735.1 CRISPR-associated protein Cas4 [Modicisalibacter sp. MOD 31.J]